MVANSNKPPEWFILYHLWKLWCLGMVQTALFYPQYHLFIGPKRKNSLHHQQRRSRSPVEPRKTVSGDIHSTFNWKTKLINIDSFPAYNKNYILYTYVIDTYV